VRWACRLAGRGQGFARRVELFLDDDALGPRPYPRLYSGCAGRPRSAIYNFRLIFVFQVEDAHGRVKGTLGELHEVGRTVQLMRSLSGFQPLM
jgi:hypothetical protein